jgi:hypothetical protein
VRWLERDVAELPGLWDDLLLALRRERGAWGWSRSGGVEAPPFISGTVADHREHVVRTVASWCLLVSEERSVTLPEAEDIHRTCAWLTIHLPWCIQQAWVDEMAEEMASLRGRAFSLAYPKGPGKQLPCIEVVETGACPGVVRVWATSTDATCDTCGRYYDDLTWLGQVLRGDDKALMDAYAASYRLAAEGFEVSPSRIRKWAEREKVQRRGADDQGRTLYDFEELLKVARGDTAVA